MRRRQRAQSANPTPPKGRAAAAVASFTELAARAGLPFERESGASPLVRRTRRLRNFDRTCSAARFVSTFPVTRNTPRREERSMAIGPVQLIVIGFDHPEFHGEIIAELERLHDEDTVRVIDALAVHKDARRRNRGPASQQPDQGRGDRGRLHDRRPDRPRNRRRRRSCGRRRRGSRGDGRGRTRVAR